MKTKRWVAALLCVLLIGSLFPVNALADSEYTEYSISVFADGNGTASADKTSAAKGEKVTLTTTPNPGYHFDRWESDDVTINVTITDISFTMPEKDVTVKAIFEADAPTTYTVTFDAGDGSVTPASGTTGTDGKLASLPMPTRSGYLFFGWFDAPTGGNRVTTDTVFTTDSTIYARWSGGGVPQGGCSLTLNENWEDGTVRTIPNVSIYVLPTIIRPGYVFDGWSTDPAGSVEYRENDAITLTADTTLYALWSKSNAPTLILNENWKFGRVRTIPNVSSYVLPTVTRFGETFFGWANAPDGMVRYRAGDTVTLTHNLTLYAIWWAQNYSIYHVIFDANGGTGTMENLWGGVAGADDASIPVTIPDCGFTREGYTFKGWATSPTGAVAYLPGNSYKSADDLFLFAVWEEMEQEYMITVLNDGNGTASADNASAAEGKTITLTATPDAGYRFKEWQSTDVTVTDNKFTMPAKAVTVTAVFEAIPTYTVTFEMNGHGTQVTAQTVEEGSKAEKPADPAAEGWIFGGWYADADCNAAFDFGSAITANTTVYAKWTKKTVPEPPVPVIYTIIAGADSEWTKGDTKGLLITSDAPFAKFYSVTVDGRTIAAANYTAVEGSTKITFLPVYLETLSIGSHSVRIVSTDGSASTRFAVRAAPGSQPEDQGTPQTGDEGHILLWIMLLLVSFTITVIMRRDSE